MGYDTSIVRQVLDQVKADGRTALTAPEAKQVCDAFAIPLPDEGLATSTDRAASVADDIGYPVVMKIVSPDILHKTEAGGVKISIASAEEARAAYDEIIANANSFKPDAAVAGVQVQAMQPSNGQEVIIGAVTDPSFGKLVAFGLGGILVEVLKDITFRFAPAATDQALSMLESIKAADVLNGVRGADPVDKNALAEIIVNVSNLISEFPEIQEMDLNPVFAGKDGAIAVDALISVDFSPQPPINPTPLL